MILECGEGVGWRWAINLTVSPQYHHAQCHIYFILYDKTQAFDIKQT